MATGYEIAEKLAGLASRVDDLAVKASGDQCRELLRQRDELIELSNQAIVVVIRDLGRQYGQAIDALDEASAQVEEAEKQLRQVGAAIEQVAKVIDLATKVLAL